MMAPPPRAAREAESLQAPQGIIGRALAQCFEIAESYDIERVLIDLNGERWRAEEFGFALAARGNASLINCAANPDAPAASMGDLAAAGAAYAALAVMQNKTSLISTSAREGLRAAMILQGNPL